MGGTVERVKTRAVRHLAAGLAVISAFTLGASAADAPQKGSRPSADLASMACADFALGQALFERPWANGLTSSSSSDGLGPLFNARACSGCHRDAGRSNALVRPDVAAPDMIVEIMTRAGPHPVLGRQLQERASPGLAAEGRTRVTTETTVFTYPDGDTTLLHRPVVEVTLEDAATGQETEEMDFAPRVAPQLWTGRAIEAVPEDAMRGWADPDDTDGDGISGRIRWTYSREEQREMAGRFGWKATTPTLPDQIANAFATDMGLSTPLILADGGDCTEAQTDGARAAAYADDNGEGPEVRQAVFDLVVVYNRGFATPPFTGDAALWEKGTEMFDGLRCNACHRHSYGAGGAREDGATPPFTDLLLHDLGTGLADRRNQGSVAASEWRTAPLVGLGQTLRSNANEGYLHDGRTLTVEQAILWHEGEARPSRDAFAAMPKRDRADLLRFLENL